MLADVQLKRVRKSKRRRLDSFFYCFYLPMNFCLIYWLIPFVFHYELPIKEKYVYQWQESFGPELWMLFHIVLAALIGMIVFWCSRSCYRPSRFIWLPLALGLISLFIYLW